MKSQVKLTKAEQNCRFNNTKNDYNFVSDRTRLYAKLTAVMLATARYESGTELY